MPEPGCPRGEESEPWLAPLEPPWRLAAGRTHSHHHGQEAGLADLGVGWSRKVLQMAHPWRKEHGKASLLLGCAMGTAAPMLAPPSLSLSAQPHPAASPSKIPGTARHSPACTRCSGRARESPGLARPPAACRRLRPTGGCQGPVTGAERGGCTAARSSSWVIFMLSEK